RSNHDLSSFPTRRSSDLEAGKDLNLLQALYDQYKANPDKAILAKIQSVIGDIKQNLPALLQAAHITNPTLLARVTAAVNLILSRSEEHTSELQSRVDLVC